MRQQSYLLVVERNSRHSSRNRAGEGKLHDVETARGKTLPRGTLIGRAFAYGLGAMGEAGVTRALEVIEKELDVTLALCGLRDVKDASRAILRAA